MAPDSGQQQPLAGVRVIEWTTMAAGPSCGQMLAVLGAEVIKVEHSTALDPSRTLALEIMPGRYGTTGRDGEPVSGACFQVVNRSKKSIKLDLSLTDDRETFSGLIRTADVFLTSVPTHSQKQLGIVTEQLQQQNPRLVVAQVQAWGDGGPMEQQPGYDNGVFYGASGLAKLFQTDDKLTMYPIAFGDMIVGLSLFSGIVAALLRQRQTSLGAQVDTSLYGMGIWAAAPYMLQPDLTSRINQSEFDGELLMTNDNYATAIYGTAAVVNSALTVNPHAAAAQMNHKALRAVLDVHRIAYSIEPPKTSQVKSVQELPQDVQSRVLPSTSADMMWESPMPIRFAGHSFDIREAPLRGEHTDQMTPDHMPVSAALVMHDPIIVVEIGKRAALSFAGRMILDFPCVQEVCYVDSQPTWAKHIGMAAHLRHGKRKVSIEDAVLMENVLFVSDMSRATCMAEGVPIPQHAAFVELTGRPSDWYLQAGFSEALRGMPHENLGQMPAYFADMCVGVALAAAMVTKAFSAASGCVIGDGEVSFLQLGLYQLGFFSALLQASELKGAYNGDTMMSREDANRAVLPCVTTFSTADSHHVTMLGPNVKVDLLQLLSCVPYARLWVLTKMPWASLRAFGLWAQGKPKLECLWPFGNVLNTVCMSPLTAMSLKEFEDWCTKSGWKKYAVVKTIHEAFNAPNTLALGLFVKIHNANGSLALIGKTPITIRPYHIKSRM